MTTEQNGKTLEELLEEINAAAAESEVAKAAKTTLEALIQLRLTEGQALEEALPGLKLRWQANHDRIETILEHLKQCHGDWAGPKQAICAHVFQPIVELRTRLEGKLGPCELRLRRAEHRLDLATKHFEAWKTIAKWASGRLDEIKKLIDEVCTLDHCKDNRFALYIVHFELLPKHHQLKDGWAGVDKQYQDPAACYCGQNADPVSAPEPGESQVALVHFPWLLGATPGEALKKDYGDWLQKAWQAQFAAGKEKARAKVAVDQIEQLKTRLAALADAAAKRQRAKDALRALKSSEPGKPDEPGKQPEPCDPPEPPCPPGTSPQSQTPTPTPTPTSQTSPAQAL